MLLNNNLKGFMNYISYISSFKGLISYDAKENIHTVTDVLAPVANKVLSQLPEGVEANVRDTTKAIMTSAGIWKQKGSEARDLLQYMNILIKDCQDHPKVIIQANHHQKKSSTYELFKKHNKAAVLDQFARLDVSVCDNIEKWMKLILSHYHEISDILLLRARERYDNIDLDVQIIPDKTSPLSFIKIEQTDDKNVLNISVEQIFQIKNSNKSFIKGDEPYESVGTICAKGVFNVSLEQSQREHFYEVTFLPTVDKNLLYEIKNYVKSITLPGEIHQMTMPDNVEVNIPDQLIRDLDRQAYYIGKDFYCAGEESSQSFDPKSFVQAIYSFTNQDKILTEDICKALTQRAFAEPTEEIYKKYIKGDTFPRQDQTMRPTFQLYKDAGEVKLLCLIYFNPFDMKSMTASEEYIRAETTINFNTGSAAFSYKYF